MSKSNTCETGILELIFQNSISSFWGSLGTGVFAAGTPGNLTIALHTSSPGQNGNQSTNELIYSGSSRLNVPRDASNWTVSGNTVSNANVLDFAVNGTGSSLFVEYVSVGTGTNNEMLYYAPVATAQGAPFVVEAVDIAGTPYLITAPGHGLIADDEVVFTETAGLTLPTGITAGVFYYVMTSPGADTFAVSTSSGDVGEVVLTAVGAGRYAPATTVEVLDQDTPRIPAGQFQYVLD